MQVIVDIENKEELQKMLDFMAAFRKPIFFMKVGIRAETLAGEGDRFITANPDIVEKVVNEHLWLK